MSVIDKLIQKILSGTQTVSYKEAEKILLYLGYSLKIKGSHHGFRKDGFRNIILKKRAQLLPYQIKEIQEVLSENGY